MNVNILRFVTMQQKARKVVKVLDFGTVCTQGPDGLLERTAYPDHWSAHDFRRSLVSGRTAAGDRASRLGGIPRAAFSQFFTIRTDPKPVNTFFYMYLYSALSQNIFVIVNLFHTHTSRERYRDHGDNQSDCRIP